MHFTCTLDMNDHQLFFILCGLCLERSDIAIDGRSRSDDSFGLVLPSFYLLLRDIFFHELVHYFRNIHYARRPDGVAVSTLMSSLKLLCDEWTARLATL